MAHSILETDGYKFSMAEVGWPLRRETFVYTHRKGGPQVLPVDTEEFVKNLLPAWSGSDSEYLAANEYAMGEGYKHAILKEKERVVVHGLPRGAIFYPGEPVFSVTGASALGSWLEPMVLQLNGRIQVATLACKDNQKLAKQVSKVTCKKQKEIILETLEDLKISAPKIEVAEEEYYERVLAAVKALIKVVRNPDRLFEVGLRSASCMEQHLVALKACFAAGLKRTSNVYGAKELGMIPVGTMGHEHVQRYGGDEPAFRAMKDRRPYRSSYLPDTYDFFLSGLPAAFRVMGEDPDRRDSIRYDSGNKESQFLYVVSLAKQFGLKPKHLIEDGLDEAQTASFETLRSLVGIDPEDMFYGYGGFIVAKPAFATMTRDEVQAVWKLSMTGPRPTMKFSSDPGKESLPGLPVVWRRRSAHGPIGIVGQEGEVPPEGYAVRTGEPQEDVTYANFGGILANPFEVAMSPATQALKDKLKADLARMRATGGMES